MRESEKYAYIGTTITAVIVILLLLFIFLPVRRNDDDEGLMISFGEVIDGAGTMRDNPVSEAVTSTPPTVTAPENKDDLLTQRDQSVVIPETRKPEPNPRPQPDPTPRPQPETPVQQPNRDDQRRIEQEAQQAQQADNLIGGSFGSGATSGSGTNTQTTAPAGNPVGTGQSGGNSWSLTGRSLVGNMIAPRYNENVEGFVTVEIRVNASGTVTSATVRRSNISSPELLQAAREAALRTKFSTGDRDVIGTITYNFKLR